MGQKMNGIVMKLERNEVIKRPNKAKIDNKS